jgi:NTP pyrophosphatase (non-canonical NTP hydrolase)
MNNNIREILLITQEECAEVIQAISKCFRFGTNHIKPGNELTNIQHLQEELGDLLAMIELLRDTDIGITEHSLQVAKQRKFEKLKKWSNIDVKGK